MNVSLFRPLLKNSVDVICRRIEHIAVAAAVARSRHPRHCHRP